MSEQVEPITPELMALVDGDPTVARLLADRVGHDLSRALAFIDPQFYTPAPPTDLPDLALAVDLLRDAIQRQATILVWGDFDVDGQTATALLMDALTPLTPTALYIPDRLAEGHGIVLDKLHAELDRVQPALLLTCDTGITEFEAVDAARERGVRVIITDHHEPGDHLPNADAVVNPHRLSPNHPLGGLPGVGVAFVLVRALYDSPLLPIVGEGLSDGVKAADRLLDLVALGVVADVAAQSGDTRYYLQLGLQQLRQTERVGLRTLIGIANLDRAGLTEDEIAFQIGPRLNAAGRIGDARRSVELLTTTDRSRALILAEQLDGLNVKRRQLQKETEAAAHEQITRTPELLNTNALVLYGTDWHGGILGPVAGHLAEKYARPVIMLTNADASEKMAKGSARSVPGYSLIAALTELSPMLTRYGGHIGAAGLALETGKIDGFRRALSQALAGQTGETIRHDHPQIDARLPLAEATLRFVQTLNKLAPFGEGNRAPIFLAENVVIHRSEFLDRAREHRRLTVFDPDGDTHFVYWWNSGDRDVPEGALDLAYTLSLKQSSGLVNITLVDFQTQTPHAVTPVRKLIDLRNDPDPDRALADLRATYPDLAIWAEGYPRSKNPGLPASELPLGTPLAIYTIPPDQASLQAVIERCNPPVIALIGLMPPESIEIRAMLIRLTGVIQAVIQGREGVIEVRELCERLALNKATIYQALRVLMHDEIIPTPRYHEGSYTYTGTVNLDAARLSEALENTDFLRYLLHEINAYRQFFRTAKPENLIA